MIVFSFRNWIGDKRRGDRVTSPFNGRYNRFTEIQPAGREKTGYRYNMEGMTDRRNKPEPGSFSRFGQKYRFAPSSIS